MNTGDLQTGIKEVDHLVNAIAELEMAIELPNTISLPEGIVLVHIKTNLGIFECIVDDEYQDISKGNIYAGLQAILFSAMDLEDQEGELPPLLENYPSEKKALQDFWKAYQQAISNPDICISPYDWQLNSGAAATLRDLV